MWARRRPLVVEVSVPDQKPEPARLPRSTPRRRPQRESKTFAFSPHLGLRRSRPGPLRSCVNHANTPAAGVIRGGRPPVRTWPALRSEPGSPRHSPAPAADRCSRSGSPLLLPIHQRPLAQRRPVRRNSRAGGWCQQSAFGLLRQQLDCLVEDSRHGGGRRHDHGPGRRIARRQKARRQQPVPA